MNNEIKNQAQEPEVKTDDELNEDALMTVAGGTTAFHDSLNKRMRDPSTSTSTNTTTTTA